MIVNNMANWNLFVDHVLKFEGGHSADPDDNALKLGHSGVRGGAINPATNKPYDRRHPNNFIHTNKGIIWATYVSYKNLVGQRPDANEFLLMPQNVWQDIYKKLFWDYIQGDKIKYQPIAEALMSAKWGGGGKSLVRNLQSHLNSLGAKLSITGTVNIPTLNAINTLLNTKARLNTAVKFLYDRRLAFLRSLSDWVKYGKGWKRRLDAELLRYYKLISITPGILNWLFILPIGFFLSVT